MTLFTQYQRQTILLIQLSCSSLLGRSASPHFQSSLSLFAHHSLNSFLVFACSMSRETLYSQYRCHVSASMIRLVCSIALVRVAKAGSLSYLFPSRVHRGAQEPAVETGSIAHPLYSTTLENPFVASFILPPNRYVPSLLLLRASLTDGKRQLVKRYLYGLTDTVELPF